VERKNTKQILVGNVPVGGGAPIAVQSMCSTDTRDIAATGRQLRALKEAGCDIARVAVLDPEAAEAISALKKEADIPIVADIHFDWRLAVEACKAGADKIRINPGNIGSGENLAAVCDICKERHIPIRVGVNSGSVEKELQAKWGVTPQALYLSAVHSVKLLNDLDFDDICISIKASDVFKTVEAYRLVSQACRYPLHLGVTEAGSIRMGTVKSAAAFGALLADGIGDTLRVSLTADPVREVEAARLILQALDLNERGVTVISCPTCGRTQVDLIPLASQVEARLRNVKAKLKVAVMGCAVNGPGEAEEADAGIACGRGEGLLFSKGKILKKVPENQLADELAALVAAMTGEQI